MPLLSRSVRAKGLLDRDADVPASLLLINSNINLNYLPKQPGVLA